MRKEQILTNNFDFLIQTMGFFKTLALLDFLFAWEILIGCFTPFLQFYTKGRTENLAWWINNTKWSHRCAQVSGYVAALTEPGLAFFLLPYELIYLHVSSLVTKPASFHPIFLMMHSAALRIAWGTQMACKWILPCKLHSAIQLPSSLKS